MKNLQLEQVRPDVKKVLEPYLRKLLDIHGENVVSIVLYGSGTGRFYVHKKSDINLMVIFDSLEFDQLKASLKLVNQGISRKITAPLFLSVSHINTSKDVFPMEFLEIKENHTLLYGKDLFTDMQIDQKYLRLFCEREIKGILLRLREAYLEVGLRRKGIEALMKKSLTSLFPTFRSLLRIKGQMPEVDKEKLIENISVLYGLDRETFLAILRDKTNDERIAGQEVEVYFKRYLSEIKKLAVAVDKL